MTKTVGVFPKATGVPKALAVSRGTRILCGLFFFSGFPALLYQLVWQRTLFQIFGVNIESVTIIVTAYMVGLGVGSLTGGVISKWQKTPLLPLLATIEFLIGTYGLFSLTLFAKVGDLTLDMPFALMAIVTLALVIVPTLLMGATLPILVGHLSRRLNNVGNSLGLLYYANTLGAGAICLIAALALFPFLGMKDVVHIAVALNFAVGLGALIAYRRDKTSTALAARRRVAASKSVLSISFSFILFLAAISGFVALSYEIFFFHVISFATGGSASAFAFMLGTFLIGLAVGARKAGEYCKKLDKEKIIRCLLRSVVAANVVGFLFLPLLDNLGILKKGVLGLALVLIFLLARYWGVLLPCLAHFGIAADAKSGMRTALLYLLNILGAATGSVLTGFVLMDHVGLIGMAMFLTAAGGICVLLLIWALPFPRRDQWRYTGWVTGVGVVLIGILPWLTPNIFENLMVVYADSIKPPFANVIENRNGIITVDQAGVVYGNGIYDGQFNVDLMNDTNGIIRPYAISLFHPAPHEVLMIGLSSGSWAQVVANNPEVKKLTIVEINPGYLKLISDRPEVMSLLQNPKVKIIVDDGRRWLKRNPGRHFDVIVANTTFYFHVYASYLLSSEFLELVKEHLKPDGVYFYNTTGSSRAQHTGCSSFPYGARFTNHMVLSMSPIDWDFKRWRRNLEAFRIDGYKMYDPPQPGSGNLISDADLTSYLGNKMIEPCPDVTVRTEDLQPVTDDNMGSEWRRIMRME